MVDLPQVPRRFVTTEMPDSRLTGADIAGSSMAIARALQQGGQAAASIAADYEKAIDTTKVTRYLDEAQNQALKLQVAANGDSEIFKKSWDAYLKQSTKKLPAKYRAEYESKLINLGGETYRSIFADAANRAGKIALDAMDTRIGSLVGEMTDLARSGQTNGEDFRVRRAELDDLLKQKTENRLIAYSPESEAADRSKYEDQFVGAAVTGELETVYARDGLGAAQKRAQEFYNDNSDGLDKVKKLKAINEGLKSVRALYATDAEGRRQLRSDADTVIAQLRDGVEDPDSSLVTDLMATADSLGDPTTRMKLTTAREIARLNPMKAMPLDQQLNYLGSIGQGGPVDLGRAQASIAGIESGGRYDILGPVLDNGDRAYGKYQVMGSNIPTWTKDALGRAMTPEEFLKDPAAQDAVFNKVFGSYVERYGNVADAASAWFTGRPLKEGAGARDVLGTTGAGYVRQFLAGYGGGTDAGYVKGVIPEIRANVKAGLTDALSRANDTLKRDQPLDPSEIRDLIDAARIVDDAGVYDQVQETITRSGTVSAMLGQPVADQAAVVDALRAPGPKGEEKIRLAALQQAEQTSARMAAALKDDPRGLGIELGLIKPGAPIDAGNIAAPAAPVARGPETTQLGERVGEMKLVEAQSGSGPLPLLQPGEAKAIGDAIAAGQGGGAYAALMGVDTDHMMATIKLDPIRDGIRGAARSNDPAKFGPAMQFLDVAWGRSPREVEATFGSDTVDLLQDWQATLRYATPEEQAKAMQVRGDPQYQERRKRLMGDGRTLARKETMASLIGDFDQPGVFNAPRAPIDEMTRDTFLSDYEGLFAQRYASTLDAGVARDQAVARMKNIWQRSDTNGGRLMMYPPELTYKSIGGSHDWMRETLDADLERQIGFKPQDYTIIADRQTQADIDAGKPASYTIAVVAPDTGEAVMLTDPSRPGTLLRYAWDASAAVAKSRTDFLAARAATPRAPQGEPPPRQPYDWITPYTGAQ